MQKDSCKSKSATSVSPSADWVTIRELTTHTLPPNAFPVKASWKSQVPAKSGLATENNSFLFYSPSLQRITLQKGKKSCKVIEKGNTWIICLAATFWQMIKMTASAPSNVSRVPPFLPTTKHPSSPQL